MSASKRFLAASAATILMLLSLAGCGPIVEDLTVIKPFDPSKYEGDFGVLGPDGYGVMDWGDGERYEGEWSMGEYSGQGTYYWPDGQRFEGQFERGHKTVGTMYLGIPTTG